MKTDHFYKSMQCFTAPERQLEFTGFYTFFLSNHSKNFYFAGELHDPWELVYVRSGQVGITADDRVYHLGGGSLILHKPLEFHQIWAESDDVKLFIASFDLCGPRVDELKDRVFELTAAERDFLEETLLRGEALCGTEQTGSYQNFIAWQADPLLAAQMVCRLETLLLDVLVHRTEDVTVLHQSPEQNGLYSQIVRILEAHIYTNITVAEVAGLCHVSTATAKQCFSHYAGCGIHKYFLKLKIRTAIQLLQSGQSVGTVSDRLQFANPNYFSCVFKRETGKRPTDYRKNK